MEQVRGEPHSLLRDYLGVLRRRLVTILACVVVLTGLALGLTLRQDPVYEASASVLLQPRLSELIIGGDITALVEGVTGTGNATEVEVMRSRFVTDAVIAELGFEPDVEIRPVTGTSVVIVSARAHDAESAARDANTYARVYTEVRKGRMQEDLEAASVELRARIVELDQQIATAQQPLADLDAQIAAADTAARRTALTNQRTELQEQINAELATTRASRATFVEQLDRLQLATNLNTTGGAQLISEAVAPGAPVEPRPLRTTAIAFGSAVIVGIGLAFAVEQLDDKVHSRVQVEAASGGLPALGLIPRFKGRRGAGVIAASDPGSPAAEAYRSLRTSVQFLGLDRPVKVVHFTSPSSGEGKTTTVANLAMTLARAGRRVVVVDADLRRPRLHQQFGIAREVGLTSVMLGEGSIAEAVVPVPGEGRLLVLPSGPIPPNPSELLALRRFRQLVATLADEADYVLIDSPPVLPLADALVLTAAADATILLVSADGSNLREVTRACELLRQVDAPLVGTVVNGVPTKRRGYGYGYGYGYGGYRNDDARPKRRWRRAVEGDASLGAGNGRSANGRQAAQATEPAAEPAQSAD